MDDTVDEARARTILEAWVRTTSMRRRGLASQLKITSFTAPGAHRVTFQSFTESRIVVPAHVPYRSGPVDGHENGPVPDAWDIPAPMPHLFTNHDQHFEMPHTSRVETCHHCHGKGRVRCGHCTGSGNVTCGSCFGSGSTTHTRTKTTTDANGQTQTETETYQETCFSCGGSGHVTCPNCSGSGEVTCTVCQGAGRLRHFQRLDVTWTNAVSVDVLEGTELPDDLIRDAEGRVALREEEPVIERTAGIEGAGAFRGGMVRVNGEIDRMANALIGKHVFAQGTKLHRQRLTVHAVPVYRAEYQWGKATRHFFVYGDERVWAPRFPISIVRSTTLAATLVSLTGAVAVLIARDRASLAHDTYAADHYALFDDAATSAPTLASMTPTDVAFDASASSAIDAATSAATDVYERAIDAGTRGRERGSSPRGRHR